MFVKPGTGPSVDEPEKTVVLKVRDPITRRLLPEEGAEVPNTSFWRRLLRDGDVVIAKPPVVETAPAAATPQAPKPTTVKAAEAEPGAATEKEA